jgi:hypothetical protein
MAAPGFAEQFRRMLTSKLRVVFENAAGELEMWSKGAQSQVEMQLRERRRGFTRRRDALQRVQGATGELESRIAEVQAQDEHLARTASPGGRAGRRSRGRSAGPTGRSGPSSRSTAAGRRLTGPGLAARASSAGNASTAATACPGRARAIPIASGCRRSCCSRPRWPPSSTTTRASCSAFRRGHAGRGAAGRRAGAVERAGLLQPRPQPAPLRAGRGASARRRFPAHSAVLATLPGIGRSTAAAIAAFCFGERAAILDGNVKRVLTRALGFDDDLASAAAQKRLWAEAEALLPRARRGCLHPGPDGPGRHGVHPHAARHARSCPLAGPLRGACPGAARALPGQDAQPQAQPACQRACCGCAWRTRVAGAAPRDRRVGRACGACPNTRIRRRCRPTAAWPGQGRWLPGFQHTLTHLDWHLHPCAGNGRRAGAAIGPRPRCLVHAVRGAGARACRRRCAACCKRPEACA